MWIFTVIIAQAVYDSRDDIRASKIANMIHNVSQRQLGDLRASALATRYD